MDIIQGYTLREIDLKEKLKIRGDALLDIGRNLHEIFKHPKNYSKCDNQNCEAVRTIIETTEVDS